ncbi:MAG: hypothetical protein D6813_15120, partial [Calditrichaeota bacterium]
MSVKKLLNIIYIVIDSARNYKTDVDERGRPDIFDRLAEKGTFFTNVVCSAPSTIMSISSMLTGLPAYYI